MARLADTAGRPGSPPRYAVHRSERDGSIAIRWLEVALRAGIAYGRDRCTIFAGGVTYFALISLFPLALFAVSIFAFFITDTADQQRVINELMDALPLTEDGGRGALEDLLDSVVTGREALGLIGLLFTAYTATALFTSVRTALNGVFHVERQRPFAIGKAIDLGLVVGFGFLLSASFALTVAIAFAQRQAAELVGENLATLTVWLASLAYLLIPPLITGLVFLLLYTRVARAGYTARQAIPGVAVAALLFEALKVGFAQYVASFGSYDATYGALGFVIILLLFFNLSAQTMLFGAEVVRAHVEVTAIERARAPFATLEAVLERLRALPLLGRFAPHLTPVAVPEAQRADDESPEARRSAWLGTGATAPLRSEPELEIPIPPTMGRSTSESLESPIQEPTRPRARTTVPDERVAERTAAGIANPTVEASGGFMRWALLSGLGAAVAIWLGDRRR
jgi:membrane protein